MEEPISRKVQSRLAWHFVIGFTAVSLVLGSLLIGGANFYILWNYTHPPTGSTSKSLFNFDWGRLILPLISQVPIIAFWYAPSALTGVLFGLGRQWYDPQKLMIAGAIAGGITSIIQAGTIIVGFFPPASYITRLPLYGIAYFLTPFIFSFLAALAVRFTYSGNIRKTQEAPAIT